MRPLPPVVEPAEPPVPKEQWLKTTLVYLTPMERKVKTRGVVYKQMMVCPRPDYPVEWFVGHVLTGRRIAHVATEDDGKLIGELLWAKCGVIFKRDSVEDIVRLLPEWAREWIDACHSSKTYLDPSPYLRS